MSASTRLYILSDLHVQGADDPVYRALLLFLQTRPMGGDTVVLAGDIFDLFIGNKTVFLSRYAEFFKALEMASVRGARFHYIEGNHDFLLKQLFDAYPCVKVHSERVSFEMQGRAFFVAHGDCVDREDYGYRFLRYFLRSFLMRTFVALAPGSLIDWIGKTSSGYSRNQKPSLPTELPLERRERLRNIYRSYAAEKIAQGCDYVILGHCHDLDEMGFTVGDRTGQYINVGYPRLHKSILSWGPGEVKIQREPLF